MRLLLSAAFCFTLPIASALAGPATTSQQVVAEVLADGFTRVALTEPAPGGWDVWASKDGIAYELKVDSRTGTVLEQMPRDSDD